MPMKGRKIVLDRIVLLLVVVAGCVGVAQQSDAPAPASGLTKWQEGKGWGWVWGKDDEVGALNEMTDASRLAALRAVTGGKVYDLGITYDRTSYKWPGHNPGEIISFRTPEGVKRQGDLPALVEDNPSKTAWHSCALFVNDNVATQIDGLAHATRGDDDHWYNGFTEAKWGGNWGPRKCDATTIPPIIARGVMIDVAGAKDVEALPSHYEITVKDLQSALERQGTKLQGGDIVLMRTGTLRHWGQAGGDHETVGRHDTAGIGLTAAKWLVEQHGAMMIGSDTSGLEYNPSEADTKAHREKYGTFMPVHNYLLIEQGVHIAEFHNLEDLARDRVYEFCYVCATNKIRGTTAGFTLRPLAIR